MLLDVQKFRSVNASRVPVYNIGLGRYIAIDGFLWTGRKSSVGYVSVYFFMLEVLKCLFILLPDCVRRCVTRYFVYAIMQYRVYFLFAFLGSSFS